MQDVLRGGKGNDRIYGGYGKLGTGGGGSALYIYGDEGDDDIWGKSIMELEAIWGGDGADLIYGGTEIDNSYL